MIIATYVHSIKDENKLIKNIQPEVCISIDVSENLNKDMLKTVEKDLMQFLKQRLNMCIEK